MSADQYVQQIYDNIKAAYEANQIDGGSVVNITINTMELVEVLPNLSGPDKKALVIRVVKMLIDNSELDPTLKGSLDMIVQLTLPTIIDAIVAATKNGFDLNTFKTRLAKWCSCCKHTQ